MDKKRMKKTIIILGVTSVITFSNITLPMNVNHNYIYADSIDSDIKLNIDKKEVKTDVSPVIENGRTLVPVRVIADNLGFEVEWDNDTKTTIMEKDGVSYFITIGDRKITTSDGKVFPLDVPAKVKDGRTMLPLRAIVEVSGASVKWDSNSRTVFVNSSGGEIKVPIAPKKKEVSKGGPVAKQELKTISYHGKTVPLEGKWKVENGDIWAYAVVSTEETDGVTEAVRTLEKLNNYYFGEFKYSIIRVYDLDYNRTDLPHKNHWYNVSDQLRKLGIPPTVVNGEIKVPTHPTQDSKDDWDKRLQKELIETEKANREFDALVAKKPKEDESDRLSKLVDQISVDRGLGFEFLEIRPFNKNAIKDVKYVTEKPDRGEMYISKNTGPLKPGDLFAVGNDTNSPSQGLKVGYYIFRIPKQAKAIHPSGDLRYGWEDTRFPEYARQVVNLARKNDDLYNIDYHKGVIPPASEITKVVSTEGDISFDWHRNQMINQVGIKPVIWGVNQQVIGHAPAAGAEVISYFNRDLRDRHGTPDGQFSKEASMFLLFGSPSHMGIITTRGLTEIQAMNIYRPDMTEMLVMYFD